MMRVDPHRCPDCGEPAEGTVDIVPGIAQFGDFTEDGITDWAGGTRMCWDGQMPQTDAQGRTLVQCEHAHDWWAVVEGLEPPPPEPTLAERLESLGVTGEDLDELVHDAASRIGSEVNNSGLAGQLRFLLEHGVTLQEIEQATKKEDA